MHDHFDAARQARDAVVRGDISRTLRPLTWLSQHDYAPEVASAWQPYVLKTQRAAREARDTDSLDDMAKGIASMALACGACHLALGRGPRMVPS